MDLPKCKICGERHRLGSCPSLHAKSGLKRVERLLEVMSPATVADKEVSASPRATGTGSAGVEGSNPSRSTIKREFRKPLAKDADKTLMATKPWEDEGISRRTWYRRKRSEGKT